MYCTLKKINFLNNCLTSNRNCLTGGVRNIRNPPSSELHGFVLLPAPCRGDTGSNRKRGFGAKQYSNGIRFAQAIVGFIIVIY